MLTVDETSAPYNQFSLPLINKQHITICAYFKSKISIHKKIVLLEANGTLRNFITLLKNTLTKKNYDIIHSHTPHVGLIFLIINLFISKKNVNKTIFTVHSSYTNFKFRNKLMLIPIFMFFKKIVFCGRASYESFPTLYIWLGGKRIIIIPNGVDLKRIDKILEKKDKHARENDYFTILSIGRLIDVKNPICLLKAFKNCNIKNSKLIFIGDGYLKKILGKTIKDQKNIKFTGLIKRDVVYEHLREADLYVSSSKIEGLPVAALEIPPHREITADVDFIRLVNPNDIEGYSKEILEVSKMLPEKRRELGEKCRKLVEKYFSLDIMLKKYEELYSELLT